MTGVSSVGRSVWNGAKRRRRSRWERGTRERVARGGVRLWAGAGGYFHEGRETIHGNAHRNIKAGGAQTRAARSGSSPERKGMWIRNQKERTGRAAARRIIQPPGCWL